MPSQERPLTVVITDIDFPSWDIEQAELAPLGVELIVGQCRTEDDVIALCADADGLIVQYAPVTRRVVEHLDRCRVISRYGIGVDTIDVTAATEAGIWVGNAGDYCRAEVAEHTLALLLASARRVVFLDRSVHRGIWSVVDIAGTMLPLSGQILGLVGLGTIGREVASRAIALGFKVLASDPAITPSIAAEYGVELVDLPTLLAQSDYVSLHSPLVEQTRHLINADRLRQMKKGSYLINTSRGGLIDQSALAEALRAGVIAGAAIDVVEDEPIALDDPLLHLDNLIITPHAAFYSARSLRELQRRAAVNVAEGLKGERPPWAVNDVKRS